VGTLWYEQFAGRDVLDSLYQSRQALYQQTYQDYLDTADTLSVNKVPIFHTELWFAFDLRESQMTRVPTIPLEYGPDKALYGQKADNPPYNRLFDYGDGLTEDFYYQFPLPEGCRRMVAVFDRIIDPQVVYMENADFEVDLENGTITFATNPFDSPVADPETVPVNGDVDLALKVFGYQCEFDWDFVFTHYGYVLDLDLESSENYRRMVESVWGSHAAGPTVGRLLESFASVYDVDLADGDETVETVLNDTQTQVITDANVYTYKLGSTVRVAVGDTVSKYEPLTETLKPLEVNGQRVLKGYELAVQVPSDLRADDYDRTQRELARIGDRDYLYATRGLEFLIQTQIDRGEPLTDAVVELLRDLEDLPGVGVGNTLLGDRYFGELYFPNTWERIRNPRLDADGNGLEFTVRGFPADVDQFWGNVEVYGVANVSLALRLWIAQGGSEAALADPASKAEAIALCERMDLWINPMHFVLWNWLASNMFMVRVRHLYTGSNALAPSTLSQTRKTIFPSSGYISFVELRIPDEDVSIGGTWGESLSVQSGPIITDGYTPSMTTEDPVVSAIEGVVEG
jgi:hypothetical protein